MIAAIAMWGVYALLGWAALIYVIGTLHAVNMDGDQAARSTIAASAYTCATLLLAFAVHWVFVR